MPPKDSSVCLFAVFLYHSVCVEVAGVEGDSELHHAYPAVSVSVIGGDDFVPELGVKVGRILGFDTYMDQNVNCVLSGSDTDSDPVTEPYEAGTAAGTHIASVLAPTAGEFVVVAGNAVGPERRKQARALFAHPSASSCAGRA